MVLLRLSDAMPGSDKGFAITRWPIATTNQSLVVREFQWTEGRAGEAVALNVGDLSLGATASNNSHAVNGPSCPQILCSLLCGDTP